MTAIKTTEPDEIEDVEQRLQIFGADLSTALKTALLTPMPRMDQHRLFWLLLDDSKFRPIEKALKAARSYASGRYAQRAIKVLTKYNDPVQYEANVAEFIAAAYYMDKFMGNDRAVEWERSLANGKNIDITLRNYATPVNIEVTGLNETKQQRDFFRGNYDIRDRLAPLVLDDNHPQFSYVYSLELYGDFALNPPSPKDFEEKYLHQFAQFILGKKKLGPGQYDFMIGGKKLADILISPLNKRKQEYVADLTVWSGWMKEGLRIKSKVIEKAEKQQLPVDEINFLYIPNLAMLDAEDYMEAMYGLSQIVVTRNGQQSPLHYADNGISEEIDDRKLPPVNGLIRSKFDYFDKTQRSVVTNHRQLVDDEVYELVA